MEKETILAKIRVTMSFSEKTLGWLEEISNSNIWFSTEGGIRFLGEYRRTWEKILINSCEPVFNEFFLSKGLSENRLPKLRIYESYHGSWIMEAALTMFGTIGSVYVVLKGISEIPKIADGLLELKDRITNIFSKNVSKEASNLLTREANKYNIKSPPSNPITTNFIIDARPLLSLTPSIMKSHKINLNVGISRDSLSIENLGEDLIKDMRIGIFKGTSPKNYWNFEDSFMGQIDILSPKQTTAKDLSEFKDKNGSPLDISDNSVFHVDCWLQDSHGIYLFMFYLES